MINLRLVSVVPEEANVLGFYRLRDAAGDVMCHHPPSLSQHMRAGEIVR